MDDGAVGHALIKEGKNAPAAAGFHHIVHEGVVIRDKGGALHGQIIAQIALHKVPVRGVAPHKTGEVAPHLDDAHGKRVEKPLQSALLGIGDDGEIIEIDAADGLKISDLFGVFIAVAHALGNAPLQLAEGDRLSVIVDLQLGAADLLQ